MKHHVYVIRCEEGKFYIGYTTDLLKRLEQHNTGISKWTKKYNKWQVIYKEEFFTRKEALIREKYPKSLKGGNRLKKILTGS